MTKQDSPIIGIDLGTTNSVVAYIKEGQPTVITENGESLLPSVVGFDATDKLITGVTARNQLAAFPDRTVASIKRRMGTLDKVPMGTDSFTPPEISAMILRRLSDRASRELGQRVTRAVITVPAFFDENQRQATREAGRLAGLTVERIINEPTAAAMVYHADAQDRRHVAVYDFGGGTFDVSIVRIESGIVEVLSSKGDTKLGGDDLDTALLNRVADKFQEQHGIDLRENSTTFFRLKQAAEKAKIRLSTEESATIAEEFIAEKDGSPLNLEYEIDRHEFDELIGSFIDRTIQCFDQALNETNLCVDQLNDIVLVGGSTRIPLVQDRLRAEFHQQPSRSVDPDLAVAMGAAVQAGMLDGISVGRVLVDIVTHTLGIEVYNGEGPFAQLVAEPMIHRNSTLPAKFSKSFSTRHDEQKSLSIPLLQGEHSDPDRNTQIGEINFEVETGEENREIVVGFELTLDGTLKAVATQKKTKLAKELVVDNALTRFQAEDADRAEAKLGAMFDHSDEILEEQDFPIVWEEDDDQNNNLSDQPKTCSELTKQAEADFPEVAQLLSRINETQESLADEDQEDLNALLAEMQTALNAKDADKLKEVSAELEDLLFYVG